MTNFIQKWNVLISPNLKRDHPLKKKENDPLEKIPTREFWLGDWLAKKTERRGGDYMAAGTDDEIIKYNNDNTNCQIFIH